MTRRFLLLLALVASGANGCAGARSEVRVAAPRPPAHGVVFTADGAGNYHAASESLQKTIDAARVPLCVDRFEWSHGYGRAIADQTDVCYSREQGRRLAAHICAYKQSCPGGEVYLLGHSAGSAVILAAAESLPPGSVERIVLLSPSVSDEYDLRPALRCARQGIDVFCSCRDRWYLGLGIELVGTADGRDGPAAGRVGFAPLVVTAQDAALYGKLRQHPWQPCLGWTANEGGHTGSYQPAYLRAYVLPLLNSNPS